ncbi:MAG: DUF1501 domain-containing protein, partial [Bryobacterales bacterium]|nr:DUF1501 domain-containing protein [Bryobacterales bacterium]
MPYDPMLAARRRFLTQSCLGLGGLALADMMAAAETAPSQAEPLTPRPQHIAGRRAKSCILLFMEGGVSQMDLFEHKPLLTKYAGKQMPAAKNTVGEIATFSAAPNRVVPPVAPFKQYGQSGRWMSTLMPHLGKVADELAFVHGIRVDNNNHGPAV